MTALSANYARRSRGVGYTALFPLNAGSVVYKGGLVVLDADGYARPGTDTAGYVCAGVAVESKTGGAADGDVSVKVEFGKEFLFTASSITQAMLNTARAVYVVDDNTIDDSAGVSNYVFAGILTQYVSTTSGYVFVPGLSSYAGSVIGSALTLNSGIAGGYPYNAGTWQPATATSGTDTACTNGTAYVGSVYLRQNATVTGVQYLVGSVGGTDKVIASLHSATGALLANSALAGATVGTAAQLQQVAFTGTYAAVGPALYFVALTFNGTTAKFRTVPAYCNAGNGVIGNGVTQTFGTAASFTAPTTFTADKVPVASLY